MFREIRPKDLKESRLYFTNFDYKIVSRYPNSSIKISTERNLKLFLIFKTRIVCAASHLFNDISLDIFRNNPFLLSDGYIIPALRSDRQDFTSIESEYGKFYNENVKEVIRWDLVDNSNWFKSRFLSEINSNESLISTKISKSSLDKIRNNLEKYKDIDYLSRDKVDLLLEGVPIHDKNIAYNIRELVYHISGSRTVNCESAFPQENYIDFDLDKKISLSEQDIAWKIFMELAIQALSTRSIPVELLDSLSFKDIIEIRSPLHEIEFQEKYNSVLDNIYKSNNLIGKDNIISMDIIESSFLEIKNKFDYIFKNEIDKFIRIKNIEKAKGVLRNTSSIALGLAGFIPGLELTGLIGVLKEIPSLVFNINNSISDQEQEKKLKEYIDKREKIISNKIKNFKFSDEKLFLESVDFLVKSVKEKIDL